MTDPLKHYREAIKRFKLIHAITIAIFTIIAIPIILNLRITPANAIDFTWTQTDWSGGTSASVVSTDVNTFLSQSSLDYSTAGQLSLGITAGWWNNSWLYRKPIIVNNAGSTLTDYQVKITVNTLLLLSDSKIQADCDDIRFVTEAGATLYYWLDQETLCGSVTTNFWVKFPSLPAGNTTINLYYGNDVATAVSSGDLTFDFFDDFSGSSLDTNKWATNATGYITGTVAGGLYQITDATHVWMYSAGYTSAQNQVKYGVGSGSEIAAEWKQTINSSNAAMGQVGAGFIDNSNVVRTWGGFEDGQGASTYCYRLVYSGAGATYTGSTVCPTSARIAMTVNGTTVKTYFNDTLIQNGLGSGITKFGIVANGYPSAVFYPDAKYDWIFIRKNAVTPPTITSTGAEEPKTASSGTLTSNIFNTSLPSNWGILTFSTTGTASLKIRTGSVNTLSDAPDFSSCSTISSGADISSNNCVDDEDQYIQYEVTLSGSAPVFSNISIAYSPADSVDPTTNASNLSIASANSGDWIKSPPTINWDVGADNIGGAGLLGYCISLDEVPVSDVSSSLLNPELSGGVLGGIDDGMNVNYCPYVVSGNSINLSTINDLILLSGKKYYFSIKAIDYAGNVWTGSANLYQDLVWFRYDNTPPTPPSFISMPSNFISSKDVTITWPTSIGTPTDDHSGLAGLQYRISSGGTWYGNIKNGNEDLTDLLSNNGTYTTDPTVDYPLLQEGINIIYMRALDNAGNTSTQLISGAIKLNTIAPGPVQNLVATPTNNVTNSYAFSWDIPSSFSGSEANLEYCYTVNTLPTINTCNYTSAGETSLAADAYATQPGSNTFYVVAKDEAGNINYATNESVEFTYSGSAPGIPQSLDVSDISQKENQDWKLAVTWTDPIDVGAGISKYKIYRATGQGLSCSSEFNQFSEVSTVQDTSFINTGLSQLYYSYCVRACDSANNCSAVSASSDEFPTGKYTTPAALVSEPVITAVSTRKAVISWSTDRSSDSKIQFGLNSNDYLIEETSVSAQVTSHTITLNNLNAGTTYFYRAKWTDEDGNTGISGEKSFTTSPAPIGSEVRAESIGISSALIRFTTEGAYKARLLYGVGSLSQFTDINTSPEQSNYVIPVTSLLDNTEYTYKIVLYDLENNEYGDLLFKFTTLPRPTINSITIEEIKGVAQPTVKINWKSNTPINSIVTYAPSTNLGLKIDSVNVNLETLHEIILKGLSAETRYVLTVRGVDNAGNEVVSSEYSFTTATDSRPPVILNLNVETSITNSSEEKNAQIIVSWTTDELSTSQVLFGEGINENIAQSTTEDRDLKFNHVIVISNLSPSQVYTIKAVSRDSQKNETLSAENVTVTPTRTDSALEFILSSLYDIFGL